MDEAAIPGARPRPTPGRGHGAERTTGVVAIALAVVVGLLAVPPVASAAELAPRDRDITARARVWDRLPDLRLAPPRALRVCGSPTGGTFQKEDCPPPTPGDRWLRFSSLLMNVGRGPLRLRARRASTEEEHMHAVQRIRRSDGTWRTVPSGATLHWAEEEDGHPHWHIEGMQRYRLFRLPTPFPGGAKVGVKRGYCVFDGRIVRPDLPFVPRRPAYPFASCGEPGESQDLLTVRVGLSVGWGDEYAWDYAGQRIPVHVIRDGRYLLCLTADPLGQVVERREGNNESWARIRLTTVDDDAGYRVRVRVLARGVGSCQTQVPYRIWRLLRTP
jgi:hypothetical protein